MQIHQHVSHGLLYSLAPQDIEQMHLSENAIHDEFDWEEYESEYADETLTNNVIDFLREFSGK